TPADCNDHKGWRVIDDAENAISDTIPDTLLTEEERWIKERQMYNVASSTNIIASPTPTIQEVIQDAQGQPIADLREIDRDIAKAFLDTLAVGPGTVHVARARTRNVAVADFRLIEVYSKVINEMHLSPAARGKYDFTQDQI